MDPEDPISQFFPDQESVDLYEVLSVKQDANLDDIKKSYRRLALVYHPDKHTSSTSEAKAEAVLKFQQIGFAYAVLSDEKRRKRYDTTGKTDEGFELAAGEDGWEAYFEAMFDQVTRGKLDEMKKEYQGSQEEIDDLKAAYIEQDGSIEEIINHIPHSTYEDEERFIKIISGLISEGALPKNKHWQKGVKDEKAKAARKKKGEKEAKEAEKAAKELGVWDEFYGSGKKGARKTKKGNDEPKADDDEGDLSALKALIQKKQKNAGDFLESLAAKYAEPSPKKGKGKKRAREEEPDTEAPGPSKKSRSKARR